jgi:universal stress protein A
MRINNIILAVELAKNDGAIIDKALELAKHFSAKITLVHAVEHITTYGANLDIGSGSGTAMLTKTEQSIFEQAAKEMKNLGKKIGIPEENQIVKFGIAKSLIIEEAQRLNADLIVVGSHGRHGVNLLLGSTANGVLHGAPCDVFSVRIKE